MWISIVAQIIVKMLCGITMELIMDLIQKNDSKSQRTQVLGVKDLWCSSTVRLLSTQILCMEGSVVLYSTVRLLSIQTRVNVKAPSTLG